MDQRTPDADLDSQQKHLASSDYDLRITNLARFIDRKILSIPNHSLQKNLLDVGAGNGLLLKYFLSQGYKVTGVELSSELVNNMKKDPKLQSVQISQGDITQLHGQEQYDVVICNDVIEHIENDALALQNLWSFVKKDGLLVVSVPAHSFLYGKRDKAWGHYRRYDKAVLQSRVEKLESAKVQFLTFWNIIGFFVYFLFEKILHKPINENMRYSSSPVSKIVRWFLDKVFRIEEFIGGFPLGLTLVIGIKKG